MADVPDVPRVQFSIITKEGFQAYSASPSVSKIEGFSEEGADYFEYSKVFFFLSLLFFLTSFSFIWNAKSFKNEI